MLLSDTVYKDGTDIIVAEILERERKRGTRLTIYYGRPSTGKVEYTDSGYVSRSQGPTKVPIMLHNSRSIGGRMIDTDWILAIRYSRKEKGEYVWIYRHDRY